MVSVDAIFFDLDGTLVDARSDIVRAANHTLRALGCKERSFEDIVSYIGTGVSDLIAKSLNTKDSPIIKKGVEIYSSYILEHPADEARLYPHVKETLEFFKKKRKFILTNRYVRFADAVLKALSIYGYFEATMGGDDENCIKPSGCLMDSIIPKIEVDRTRALIVGDMTIDIETGKNSGIKTCWVTYGLGKREDVEPLKPDFIIDDLSELKDIVE